MAINRVDTTVATLGELATVHVSELKDGAEAWIVDLDASFVLIKDGGGLIPDGITVVAPLPGSPRAGAPGALWERVLSDGAAEKFANQPVWFIDPVNGDDGDSGKTAADAIKTHAEFVRRIDGAVINIDMTINLMNNFPSDNPVWVDFTIGSSGTMTYKGIKLLTTIQSGTFTAVNPIDRTALGNHPNEVTDAAALWASSINTNNSAPFRIRITTGPIAGSISWASKDLGAGAARVSAFVVNTTSLPLGPPASSLTPSVGDGYVVETGFVKIDDFRVNSKLSSIMASGGFSTRMLFADLDLTHDFDHRPLVEVIQENALAPSVVFSGCELGFALPGANCIMGTVGCRHSGDPAFFGAFQHYSGQMTMLGDLVLQFLGIRGKMLIGVDTLFDGGFGTLFAESGSFVLVGACCVMDSGFEGGVIAGEGATIINTGVFSPPALYGQGNSAFGIAVGTFASLVYDNGFQPVITGVAGDTLIGGVPTAYGAIPFANAATLSTINIITS